MTSPATPKKSTPTKSRVRKAVKKPVVRKRAVKKKVATVEHAITNSSSNHSDLNENRRVLSGKLEQLAILGVALLFGLIGLAVHFLWFVSIVSMALLAGLMAAEIRGARGRGVISEVVTEAKIVVEEISNGAASKDGATSGDEDVPPVVSTSP
jgi:hypothetical protein